MSFILLVDDSDRLSRGSAESLVSRLSGVDVVLVSSYWQARMFTAEHTPDVVVLNWLLPDGNGLSLMVDLLEFVPETPIIMMSNEASPEFRDRAIARGAFDVLEKPYDMEVLVSAVRRALRVSLDGPGARVSSGEPASSPESRGVDSGKVMRKLSELQLGLRAFDSKLRSRASDCEAVNRVADEHLGRLMNMIRDVIQIVDLETADVK